MQIRAAIIKPVDKKLSQFVELFFEYNQHTNLSAIRDKDAIWQKHVTDSLKVLDFEHIEGKVLDLGTGGGLPGIPLAIANPEAEVILLDSVGKKIKACEHFISELGLKNTKTLHGRAEKLGQKKLYAKNFDVIVSRATAYLPTILAWAEQFVTPNGKIMLYKTPSAEELADGEKAAEKLRLKLEKEHTYKINGQERKLLVYSRN